MGGNYIGLVQHVKKWERGTTIQDGSGVEPCSGQDTVGPRHFLAHYFLEGGGGIKMEVHSNSIKWRKKREKKRKKSHAWMWKCVTFFVYFRTPHFWNPVLRCEHLWEKDKPIGVLLLLAVCHILRYNMKCVPAPSKAPSKTPSKAPTP